MPAMTKPLLGRSAEAAQLKSELGQYIRNAREKRGMTQAELAREVGIEYYTAISAIEVGRNTVPPERYLDFAKALGIPYAEFAKKVLRLTNPWAYEMIFNPHPEDATEDLNQRLSERYNRH